jgi:histidinol-phosphate aminotransferase
MSLTRRGFAQTVAMGTTGILSSSFIVGRGLEAAEFEPGSAQVPYDDGDLRLSSNENARGPGPKAIQALHQAISPRAGRGYPPDHTDDLVATIAEEYDVEADNVVVGTGSGALLAGAVRAFCSPDQALVTAAPTYGTPERTAAEIYAPIKMIAVDRSLGLNLDRMAQAAIGSGMVYFCNPNNPTGTVHRASDVEDFVRKVMRTSPDTRILMDEAYIDYTFDSDVGTAAPLTTEFANVFVTRSMSKAHGMAGLRVGYAIGQRGTLNSITRAWNLGSVNTLSAAAAIASLRDPGHIDDERRENARVREFTLSAFRDMGFEAPDSHTNHVFVDLGRPASEFREACLKQKVRVGRDFSPLERTHSRISLGTMEEMEKAVPVFRSVLT